MEYYFAVAVQKITEGFSAIDFHLRKLGQILVDGYQTPLYVFLQGFPTPFRTSQIQLTALGTPPILWFYEPERRLFYKRASSSEASHRLPFLTAEIKQGDTLLYDCSDFFNSLRWQAPEGTPHPSFEEILAAWTLESGIVLAHNPSFTLECFNEEGDTVQHTFAVRRPV